jgi:hypothetical protein
MPTAGKTICVTTDIPLTAGIIVPLRHAAQVSNDFLRTRITQIAQIIRWIHIIRGENKT